MARITQEFKTETRECIIMASEKYFSEYGFDKAKTKSIAQACNIAEGTLFNYFPTKDELLVAVFEHFAKEKPDEPHDTLPRPMDYLIASTLAPMKSMNRIPKSLLLDLLISSIKIARKKPKLFHRLAAMDLDYILLLKQKLDVFGDFRNHELMSQDLAEMIYGIVATDFLLYMYQQDMTFDQFVIKVKPKIKALLKPYLKENARHD